MSEFIDPIKKVKKKVKLLDEASSIIKSSLRQQLERQREIKGLEVAKTQFFEEQAKPIVQAVGTQPSEEEKKIAKQNDRNIVVSNLNSNGIPTYDPSYNIILKYFDDAYDTVKARKTDTLKQRDIDMMVSSIDSLLTDNDVFKIPTPIGRLSRDIFEKIFLNRDFVLTEEELKEVEAHEQLIQDREQTEAERSQLQAEMKVEEEKKAIEVEAQRRRAELERDERKREQIFRENQESPEIKNAVYAVYKYRLQEQGLNPTKLLNTAFQFIHPAVITESDDNIRKLKIEGLVESERFKEKVKDPKMRNRIKIALLRTYTGSVANYVSSKSVSEPSFAPEFETILRVRAPPEEKAPEPVAPPLPPVPTPSAPPLPPVPTPSAPPLPDILLPPLATPSSPALPPVPTPSAPPLPPSTPVPSPPKFSRLISDRAVENLPDVIRFSDKNSDAFYNDMENLAADLYVGKIKKSDIPEKIEEFMNEMKKKYGFTPKELADKNTVPYVTDFVSRKLAVFKAKKTPISTLIKGPEMETEGKEETPFAAAASEMLISDVTPLNSEEIYGLARYIFEKNPSRFLKTDNGRGDFYKNFSVVSNIDRQIERTPTLVDEEAKRTLRWIALNAFFQEVKGKQPGLSAQIYNSLSEARDNIRDAGVKAIVEGRVPVPKKLEDDIEGKGLKKKGKGFNFLSMFAPIPLVGNGKLTMEDLRTKTSYGIKKKLG